MVMVIMVNRVIMVIVVILLIGNYSIGFKVYLAFDLKQGVPRLDLRLGGFSSFHVQGMREGRLHC